MLRGLEMRGKSWDAFRRSMARYCRACADLLLPRKCLACGRRLLLDEDFICLGCRTDMPLTRFWERSHNPMADRFNALLQGHLEDEWLQETIIPDGFEGIEDRVHERYAYACALFFYSTEAGYRKIPYSIKYEGNIPAGKHFGKMLGKRLSESVWFSDVDMVIPVPLHWKRKWKRGYNQAEIIAGALAHELGATLRTDILRRTRNTVSQTRLDIREKARNVAGAFEVSEQFVRFIRTAEMDGGLNCSDAEASSSSGTNMLRHILLVDDTFTTGSTLMACFVALRSVFPASVRISVATLGFVGEP